MRTADLGANCTDSIALFDYAFDNFDTLTVNGKKMTVPKGVTADQLTVEQVDKNGTMLNRYFYNGQYVGYAAPAATPTPQAVADGGSGNRRKHFRYTDHTGRSGNTGIGNGGRTFRYVKDPSWSDGSDGSDPGSIDDSPLL